MQYVSPGAQELCGFDADDLLGGKIDWGSLVHPDDVGAVEAEIALAVAEGRPFEFIYRIRDASGHIKWVHEKGQAAPAGVGGESALVGFIMHVTVEDVASLAESKAIIFNEAELRRSVETELIYKAGLAGMGTMAATLAHELNQPLTAISFYAGALKQSLPERGNDSAADLLDYLRESALHAGNIVRRLREFVLTGTRGKDRFDTGEVINEAVRLARLDCERVSLDLSVEEVTLQDVDRVQFQQVLVNLLRNACEAVTGVSAPRVRIAAEKQLTDAQPTLRISVSDNGPGIPDHLIAKVFESGVSTKVSGMGVGLAISRTIVEAHRGRIWAESSHAGATIRFELPLARC